MEFDEEDLEVEPFSRPVEPLLAQPIHYICAFLFLHARKHAALLQASPDLCLIRVSAVFFFLGLRGWGGGRDNNVSRIFAFSFNNV